jgi:ATPase family associated with various cellular activities (AAA).
MKIALTGSHGTGKTTLAWHLANKLDLPLIVDRARDVAKKAEIKHVWDLRQDKFRAAYFQCLVLIDRLSSEQKGASFISDRSTLDLLAYWQAYGLPENKAYQSLCLANPYDLLVYVPIEFPPAADGFRDTDPEFQREVDRRIRELLQLVPWPVVAVSGSVEERAQMVMEWLAERNTREYTRTRVNTRVREKEE